MRYIISAAYRKKLADACEKAAAMPLIKWMAIGNGAEDENGAVIELTGNEAALHNELLRKELDTVNRAGDLQIDCDCNLTMDELSESRINEIALFDTDGDPVAIKVFEGREKKQGMEMTFRMSLKY